MSVIAENPYLEVHDSMPTAHGLYVIYTDDPHVARFAKRVLMTWFQGRWSYTGSDQRYRGHVYGWIGPLPALQLDDNEPENGERA